MRAISRTSVLLLGLVFLLSGCGSASPVVVESPTEAGAALRCAPEGAVVGQRQVLVHGTADTNPVCMPLFLEGKSIEWLECLAREHETSTLTESLVSVGCYDAASAEWQIGGCPVVGESVTTGRGTAITTGELVPAYCVPSGDWKISVALAPGPSAETAIAVSTSAAEHFVPISGQGPPSNASVEAAIEAAVARDSDKPGQVGPQILQVVPVEANGEPGGELLVSVVVRGSDPMMPDFSALYLVPSSGEGEPVLLLSSDLETFSVLALSDLDGDCKQEILVLSLYYEGEYTMMFRFAGDDLVQLGGWGCGA